MYILILKWYHPFASVRKLHTEVLSQFSTFVNANLDSKLNLNWTKLSRLYCAGDTESLKLLKELFERFQEKRGERSNMSNE